MGEPFYGKSAFPTFKNPFHEDLYQSILPFHLCRDVAYLFIAGLNDSNCPSKNSANLAEKMLAAANYSNYRLLRYSGAGHILEPCYGIHHRVTAQKLNEETTVLME